LLSLYVTTLKSGVAINSHPSVSKFSIDRRLVPGESIKDVHTEFLSVLNKLRDINPEFDYKYEIICEYPCLQINKNSRLVKAICAAFEEVMGEKAEFYCRAGCSDAAYIVQETGMAMPNFGPGNDVEEATSKNEKLSIDEYLSCVKIYMMVLLKILS
jgi:acetylornithine deacetylase/succinyl-diaminopimelate desuccinylase-like protein